jgi:hypothetical protein
MLLPTSFPPSFPSSSLPLFLLLPLLYFSPSLFFSSLPLSPPSCFSLSFLSILLTISPPSFREVVRKMDSNEGEEAGREVVRRIERKEGKR